MTGDYVPKSEAGIETARREKDAVITTMRQLADNGLYTATLKVLGNDVFQATQIRICEPNLRRAIRALEGECKLKRFDARGGKPTTYEVLKEVGLQTIQGQQLERPTLQPRLEQPGADLEHMLAQARARTEIMTQIERELDVQASIAERIRAKLDLAKI